MIPTSSKRPEDVAPQPPRVHAIVVTWNGAELLPQCLQALQAQDAAVRITVADNASTDGTAALLARDFPGVAHLLLPANLGYGRANNEAMRLALAGGAEFVALVNNDVTVAPDWASRLLRAADAQARAGLFTGTLLFHGEETVNSTGLEIDAVGRARDRDFRVPLSRLAREDGPVAGVSGGAALLRASMLREVGLFDPAYFAYYEDVDLSLRAARAGWTALYVRGATARHRFGASFRPGSPLQRYLLGVGHLRTLALHQPLLKAAALVPLTVAWRAAVKAPLELLRRRPALAWAELRAAGAGAAAALRALSDRSLRRR
ncbi:MAG TPA: glycosyltransferase family 2 protein [Myxococcales bacterium]|nr:glycosyltransferase family 2 protein [Myxococcales bacterium]